MTAAKRYAKYAIKLSVLILSAVYAIGSVSAERKTLLLEPIRITLDDSTGAFFLHIRDEDSGNWISLLESAEHGTTSGFYVKNGNSVRKLASGTGVQVSANVDESTAVLSYTVSDNFVVDVRFEPFRLSDKKGTDGKKTDNKGYESIRVDIAIKNISPRAQVISVKGVFDTWLGEQTASHFVTANENVINTERRYDTMEKVKYIRSSGRGNAVQLLLNGADISVPDGVYIANRDALLQDSWVPTVRDNRTFDSIETYNNSAIGVNWHQVSLSPQTKSNLCFYITVATGDKTPGTVKTLGLEESIKTAAADSDVPTYTDSYGTTYTMGAITQEQLDPAYISDLLERISELENDSDNATRDEIRKLNAELDAIFVKMGRSAD